MCTVHCNCKPKTLYSAAEVALILTRIKSRAEESGTWEGTVREYRSQIAEELRKLPTR